ncbi:hypothetical protein FQZ97_777050 [compost metagenome]
MNSVRDPGLQPERTRLAWNRTALAMGACALLVIRAGLQSGELLSLMAGGLLCVATCGLVVIGMIRSHQLERGLYRAPPERLVLMTWLCPAIAAGSFVWSLLTNLH